MGLIDVVEGFILAVIITLFFAVIGVNTVLGFPISIVGFFIAGIIIGYKVYGVIAGVINGAFIGIIGAIILWILSLFLGQIATFSAEISSYVGLVTVNEIIIVIVVGAIGGLIGGIIGSLVKRRGLRGGRRW